MGVERDATKCRLSNLGHALNAFRVKWSWQHPPLAMPPDTHLISTVDGGNQVRVNQCYEPNAMCDPLLIRCGKIHKSRFKKAVLALDPPERVLEDCP